MAKDPAFLFYPKDFLSGTQFFSDEQVGKYIRLLIAQHQTGHLEEKHMIMICKTYDKDVFSKFIRDNDGLYYNERLEDETIKRKDYCQSRSENRKSKKTYVPHMVNGNANGNTSKKESVRGNNFSANAGIEFSEDNSGVFFSDGSFQPLGDLQKESLEIGTLKPHLVIKGSIY